MIQLKGMGRIVHTAALFLGLFLTAASAPAAGQVSATGAKIDVARISPQEARAQVSAGKALLVCAYADEKACSTMMLEGAVSLKEFESRLAGLEKDQPIIFYCS
jgi:hypothetical protein